MRACSFVALSWRENCFDDLHTVKTFYQDADGLSVKSGAVCFCDSDHCNGYDVKSLEEKAKDGNQGNQPWQPRTTPDPDTSTSVAVTPSFIICASLILKVVW